MDFRPPELQTNSSTITGALPAGTNIIGKVTTDQTTHGTTDLVAADLIKVGGAVFALGQQLAASSLPVVLTSAQLTTLTPFSAVTATLAANTGVDIGKLTANQSVNLSQVAGGTAINGGVTGSLAIGGSTANNVTAAGNPIGIAGQYSLTPPTLTDGWQSYLQLDAKGDLRVQLMNAGVTNVSGADNVDGSVVSATSNKAVFLNRNTVFNGTSWDRQPGNTVGAFSAIKGGLMPDSTALNTYAIRITTNTTTTPTSSTSYISTIGVSTEAIGTTSTIKIQDKSGTPLVLVPAVTTTTAGLVIYNFQTPIKMTSGIDIITAGAGAATVDVWINYYQ